MLINHLPIKALWNFPILIIGPIHFRFNGCCVVVFIFIQILIDYCGGSDQARRSATSDLGLHCLPRSNKKDARLKWVKSEMKHAVDIEQKTIQSHRINWAPCREVHVR